MPLSYDLGGQASQLHIYWAGTVKLREVPLTALVSAEFWCLTCVATWRAAVEWRLNIGTRPRTKMLLSLFVWHFYVVQPRIFYILNFQHENVPNCLLALSTCYSPPSPNRALTHCYEARYLYYLGASQKILIFGARRTERQVVNILICN